MLGQIIASLNVPCRRLLAGDGITTVDFTLGAFAGVVEGIAIDARAARKRDPGLGGTFGTAKNLDEYQYRICTLLPSLADSNLSKLQLQKYRVGIIASFAKLATTIRSGADILEWNKHAQALLVEASDAYVAATRSQKMPQPNTGDAFQFFGVPEEQVDRALRSMYGY